MESKVNYTVVGLFVVVLTVAIVLAIIWLAVGFNTNDYRIYQVLMTESVTGLSIDSPVRYSGVDVGKVDEIKLHIDDPRIVDLLLKIQVGTPITQSTVATLSTQGITGVAFIDLQTRGLDTRPLLRQPGQNYPIIPTTPSLFFRLDQAINQLTDDFQKISDAVSAIFDPENRLAIKRTLSNLDRITTGLAGETQNIKSIIHNTNTATRKLPGLFDQGQTTVNTFNQQTLPKVNDVLSGFQSMTNNLVDTSRNIKQNPGVLLRGQTARPLGPGER